MNRQTKRMMQRQGQLAPDGTPARRAPQPRPAPRPVKERTGPGEYARQVRAELRKVAWPTRAEVIARRGQTKTPVTNPTAFPSQHYNGPTSWAVARNGEVTHVYA